VAKEEIAKELYMTGNQYQEAAHKFALYGNPEYAYAGLAEECGEVLGKRAKFIRKHGGISPDTAKGWESLRGDIDSYITDIKKELGDVLWMVAEIATTNGLSLDEIMQHNIEKLSDRLKRNVIIGNGDNR
jgi:NTP pyrophosphatase (non-canonical NTP hydrolase)